jgi:hypothetical protein
VSCCVLQRFEEQGNKQVLEEALEEIITIKQMQ